MKLKCKQGDMAVIINGGTPFNIGTVVTCVKFVGDISKKFNVRSGNYWEVDKNLPYFIQEEGGIWVEAYKLSYVQDAYLLPIPPLKEDDTNVHSVDDALNTIV